MDKVTEKAVLPEKLVCLDCGKIDVYAKFPTTKKVLDRHSIGERFSDKECPDCGALAYPSEFGMVDHVVIHEHKHGVSVFQFRCENSVAGTQPDSPEGQYLCDELGIDFEPERGESLEIYVEDNSDSTAVVDFSKMDSSYQDDREDRVPDEWVCSKCNQSVEASLVRRHVDQDCSAK